MVSVELQNILVHAFHGIYGGEDRIGSNYEIGLKVSFEEGKSDFSDINDTINYADLFAIVKQRMQVPTPLLEKVGDGFAITASHLDVVAKVPGATAEKFDEIANKAKAGCPVSKVLNAKITMLATLEA